MRIVVLGGGVIGVASAYWLAGEGHEVVVVERREGVAEETSFANAGMIAPGHVHAWASPSAPWTLLQSLFRRDTALKLRLRFDPEMWAWGLRFLAQCTTAANRANTLVKLRLCLFCLETLKALRAAEPGLDYDGRAAGALYLYRDPAHYERGLANMALLQENGLSLRGIDGKRCAEIEPALGHLAGRLAGAIYSPDDESGDSHRFTLALAERCRARGVAFRFATEARGLALEGGRIGGVVTASETIAADAVVVALASESPRFLRALRVRLPIYPVKGYSLTLPAGPDAPTVPGVDEGYLVAFSRLGDRLRLTGTADFAGHDTGFRDSDFATLMTVARELFPEGGDFANPEHFACLRPMTPDGPPLIGRVRGYDNLWLNTGHGHMGWTMATGSARLLTDLIAGRTPALPAAGFDPNRY